MRFVGVGQAAIAVPLAWGTNQLRCGTPMHDTVVIDPGGAHACGQARPAGVDSVELFSGGPRRYFTADRTLAVDGLAAQRQTTRCAEDPRGKVCYGTVYIPSLRVSFRAESSTGAAVVDRILEQVRVLPGQVAVPGFIDQDRRYYEGMVRDAGLTAEIRGIKRPGYDPGSVLDVSPPPGTMVAPGTVVTATVVAEPEGPADAVGVELHFGSPRDASRGVLKDPQIRAGGTISLDVGDRISLYGYGKWKDSLAGELAGNSLTMPPPAKRGPKIVNSWVAAAPGRSTLTVTVTGDGERHMVGVVTVIVR
jgi:hypothetical protein